MLGDHMNTLLFFKGALIGFSVAVPLGPIGILCIRQTLGYGFWGGMTTGLGATVADGLYTALTCTAAAYVMQWIETYQNWFNFLGGSFLVYLAASIYRKKEQQMTLKRETRDLLSSFFYTLALTFLSPMTTFLFLSMFMSYNVLTNALGVDNIAYLSLGVAMGSCAWWVILSTSISRLYKVRQTISLKTFFQTKPGHFARPLMGIIWPTLKTHHMISIFQFVNRLSAIAIAIYGGVTLLRIVGI